MILKIRMTTSISSEAQNNMVGPGRAKGKSEMKRRCSVDIKNERICDRDPFKNHESLVYTDRPTNKESYILDVHMSKN